MRTKNKRFSVSLSVPEYKKLQRIAAAHRPRLSMQYIVHWALQGVLDRAEDPQLLLDLGNPLSRRKP
ncbi:MAG TPA: hypothetical protein PK807_05990 [Verrucomicrobiota bacterium]|jgi:hypothetical protein|nr:hypothetical protein [Verrucomicrobiota bacterium]